jgi:hypothetical protein
MTDASKKHTFHAPYTYGDVVYLRCREDAVRGMITRVSFYPGGSYFEVTWGNGTCTWHYPMELSTEYVPTFKGGA